MPFLEMKTLGQNSSRQAVRPVSVEYRRKGSDGAQGTVCGGCIRLSRRIARPRFLTPVTSAVRNVLSRLLCLSGTTCTSAPDRFKFLAWSGMYETGDGRRGCPRSVGGVFCDIFPSEASVWKLHGGKRWSRCGSRRRTRGRKQGRSLRPGQWMDVVLKSRRPEQICKLRVVVLPGSRLRCLERLAAWQPQLQGWRKVPAALPGKHQRAP
mmetsp:Transcript_31516/g.81904  ORF Transcript_31516/g.81904 Transcript_31516/m.81904 type:complete len:209 (+) Transcript_31516:645-1271(+)